MAERFAEILRGAIATLGFDHGKAVTCSFGVAQLTEGESAAGALGELGGRLGSHPGSDVGARHEPP